MSVTILRKVSVTGGTVLRAANNLGDVGNAATAFGNIKQAATTSATGVVELATNAEAVAGTDTSRAITPSALKAGLADEINARAIEKSLVFDGTAGAAVVGVPAFGTGDFTVAAYVVPASVSVLQNIINGAANSFGWRINSGAALLTSKTAVADNTASTGTLTAGEAVFVSYVRTGGVGTYYINGGAAGTTIDTRDYSVPVTTIGSASGGGDYITGILRVLVFNKAFSGTEILSIRNSGPGGVNYNSASNTSLITGGNTWGGSPSAQTHNSFSYAAPVGGTTYISSIDQFSVRAGGKYRVAVAGTLCSFVMLSDSSGNNEGTTRIDLSDGAVITAVADSTTATLVFRANNGEQPNITGISLVPIGLYLDTDYIGAGPQARARTGTSGVINLPGDGVSGGVTWSIPGALACDFGETKTASGYALGRDAVVIPEGFRIARIWVSGDGTFSIGNAAAGTEVVNAFTATATTQPATLAAYTTSSRKLYITLGTATTLTYAVHLERI